MNARKTVVIRIRRQESSDKPPRWEEFSVPFTPKMTVVSCLNWIAANPTTAAGMMTTPPAWETGCLEEVCGACTMVINGRARQACSAFIEQLGDSDEAIAIEPMSKFPVVRDLIVDRSRFFNDLKRVKTWVPIDGSLDQGPGSAVTHREQEQRHALSCCIACGCCMDACPQYKHGNKFVGAAVISQARLFNQTPVGAELKSQRIESLMEEGGVQDCGKAANCVAVCPKEIPLLESIAVIGRQATVHTVRKFFAD